MKEFIIYKKKEDQLPPPNIVFDNKKNQAIIYNPIFKEEDNTYILQRNKKSITYCKRKYSFNDEN